MATLTPGNFTYAEWAARMDPDGKVSTLVDLLSQNNGILEDCMAVECQSGNAYEFTQVVSLPTPSRRAYNVGVVATMAGVTKQVQTCAEYGDWVYMDQSLAELGGNVSELRAQEIALHMEGLSQLVASDLFYANRASNPLEFTGLANIYNTVSTATSQIASNVIDCGGTGSSNTSMWMLTWGPKHLHTIFPKGIPAGMRHIDYGKQIPLKDSANNQFPGYQDYIGWSLGLCIHDWRFCVRAANIDVTLLSSGSAANLIAILTNMMMKMPIMPAGVGPIQTSDAPDKLVMGRSAIYCNRTIYTALDLQAQNKTNLLLKMEEWDGHAILTWRGVPIRNVDAILNNENRVV